MLHTFRLAGQAWLCVGLALTAKTIPTNTLFVQYVMLRRVQCLNLCVIKFVDISRFAWLLMQQSEMWQQSEKSSMPKVFQPIEGVLRCKCGAQIVRRQLFSVCSTGISNCLSWCGVLHVNLLAVSQMLSIGSAAKFTCHMVKALNERSKSLFTKTTNNR